MRPRPLPLPASLRPIFSIADAIATGIRRDQLRGHVLSMPTRGVRSLRDDDRSVRTRAQALRLVLPAGAVFSHTTAAELFSLPVPSNQRELLHVTTFVASGGRQIRRRGLVAHRCAERRVGTIDGLPVTHVVDTWLDCAPLLDVDELVVLGDAIVTRKPALLRELHLQIAANRGARGLVKAREALRWIRIGSASRMETRARLVMVRGGLPEPELNQDLLDDAGGWIGRPDFLWRPSRLIAEYEGDHHRTDRQQWMNDVFRNRSYESWGWRYVLLTADDVLRRPAHMVQMLREWLNGAA